MNDAAFIHPTAALHGEVTLEEESSIWPYAVIRAELHEVRIGRFTNIQDFVMVHVGWDTPVVIGEYCSITHHCTLHGCTIGDNCLIGINSTIMDGCVIGANSIVAGHSFLREGTIIPENSVVMGTPGKVVRTANNFVANRINALMYTHNARAYARGHHRAWSGEEARAAFEAARQEAERDYGDRYNRTG